MKYVITGANGKFGHMLLEKILKTEKGENVGVSVRDTSQSKKLKQLGVRVREGDFQNPESLTNSFESASQLVMISASIADPDSASRASSNAVSAAVRAGVRRVLYTSHMGSSLKSLFPPMTSHAATEAKLEESGLSFVSLRNGFYAESALQILSSGLETGLLELPEDGAVSWTSHEDLTDAALAVLKDETMNQIKPSLTSRTAFNFQQIAEIASEVTGRKIRRVAIADQVYRDRLVARKLPEAVIKISIGLFLASRNGEFALTDPTLEGLLGKKPQTIEDVIRLRFKKL